MDANMQPKNARTNAIENLGLECCISDYILGCEYLSPENISERISEEISEDLPVKYNRNYHFSPEEYRDILTGFQKDNPILKERLDSLANRLFRLEKNVIEFFPKILIFYLIHEQISPEPFQTYMNIHSRALEIYRAVRKEYSREHQLEVISR